MTVLNTSVAILIMVAANFFRNEYGSRCMRTLYFFKKNEQNNENNLFYKESHVLFIYFIQQAAQYHYVLHENDHCRKGFIFIQIQNTSYYLILPHISLSDVEKLSRNASF